MEDEQGHHMMSMGELPGLPGYVQARRVEVYLPYDQLAARLGTDVKWLFALEDGRLPGIEFGMLVRLAVALEVDQAILMHHARMPGHLTSRDPSGHLGAPVPGLDGQLGSITEDVLLFSDRQSDDDRTHIAKMQQSPERPVADAAEEGLIERHREILGEVDRGEHDRM
jgi:hypothetical protein